MSTKLTLQALESFLQPPLPNRDLAAYMDAAAVLSAFDLFGLCPVGGKKKSSEQDQLIDNLLPLCEQVTQGPDRGLWSLSILHRRSALRRLRTRKKMKFALQANPVRPATPTQQMWERVLTSATISLAPLSRDELAALTTVVEWVEGILSGIPKRAEVLDAIRRADLLAPMRRLAETGFVGREAELAQLSGYVFGPKETTPLYVFGSGGVGKSTLIARFILQSAVPQDVVLVYIDLDRPTVRADRPLTLFLDAVNQIGGQVPTPRAESVIKEVTYALGSAEDSRHLESAAANYLPTSYIAKNVEFWLNDRILLFVVDTMEEAQFLGSEVMTSLMDFLMELDSSIPSMRLILSGRVLAPEFIERAFPSVSLPIPAGPDIAQWLLQIPGRERPVNMTVLEIAPARQLLRESLAQEGLPALTEPEEDETIGIVSRNPMCLKLAARLLRDEGVEKLRVGSSEFLSKLRAEKLQALLYGRILGHIHDDVVRKLAYPGLIVRRLDADVIREVLAKPCGLDLLRRNEYEILHDLSREASLVERDPEDSSLRHRADVRRVMLEDLLEHVEKATVAAIDDAAIDFYRQRTGTIARAEEIYHRLRRCQSTDEIEERWTAEAGGRLQNALDELSPTNRLWLAEHLGVTLDESIRKAADQDVWERQVVRAVERYLRSNSPHAALKILRERSERMPRSSLYALEAETYRILKRYEEAVRVIRAGVDSATRDGAIDMALDLLLLGVVIQEVRNDLEAAEQLVEEAAAIASHTANRILQLRVLITRLRIQRELRPDDREERNASRDEALAQINSEMLHKLRSYPVLLREVAAELAKHDRRIAATAIETLGVEVATDAQAKAFGEAVVNLRKDASDRGDSIVVSLANHFENTRLDAHEIRNWVTQIMTTKDTQELGGTILDAQAGKEALSGFRRYFREGVSNSLRGIGRIGDDEF